MHRRRVVARLRLGPAGRRSRAVRRCAAAVAGRDAATKRTRSRGGRPRRERPSAANRPWTRRQPIAGKVPRGDRLGFERHYPAVVLAWIAASLMVLGPPELPPEP